jgi:hypothetical protein
MHILQIDSESNSSQPRGGKGSKKSNGSKRKKQRDIKDDYWEEDDSSDDILEQLDIHNHHLYEEENIGFGSSARAGVEMIVAVVPEGGDWELD